MRQSNKWNGDAALKLTTEAAAETLLRMAIRLQTYLMEKLNVLSPRKSVKRTRNTVAGAKGSSYQIFTDPSKAGEYLKKRTGWAQAHVVIEPTTVAGIAQAGHVRIGWGASAFYGAAWELKPPAQRRKGLLDALDEIKPELMAMARKKP
jgi:hypothetical protein